MRLRFSLFLVSCLVSVCAFGQSLDTARLVVADVVTIHSKVLNEKRKIQIYTPRLSSFDSFDGMPLPVLYLIDGDVLTGVVASQLNYLSTSYYILPPMIVVGISTYDHDRLRDLTPSVPKEGFGGVTDSKAFGGGDKFVEFMSKEVFPYIEGRYKTQPFRILAGHSMGGLLSFHCLVNHTSLFNAYFAISPSLWWDHKYSLRAAYSQLNGVAFKNRFLFLSDANEGGDMHPAVLSLDSMLTRRSYSGLSHKYVPYPEESHGSEPIKALYDAMKWLYPSWYPGMEDSTAVQVEKHFKSLSMKYGYEIAPPEWFVSKRGARILRSGKTDDAIAFFELNTKNYPTSAGAFMHLGDAYKKKGLDKKALECYRRAEEVRKK